MFIRRPHPSHLTILLKMNESTSKADPSVAYTLLEKLGTGSFGTVWKASHNVTKEIVAIKTIGE